MHTVKEKNETTPAKKNMWYLKKMQYVPVFLFFIIALLAYWVTMKSFPAVPKKKNRTLNKNAFLSKTKFEGHRVGYVFKNGNLGLGYYVDDIM